MTKKRKRKLRKTLIPKEWKAENGITALPDAVRVKVKDALTRVQIGAAQQDDFFLAFKLSNTQRQAIAYELSLSGVSYQDVSTLLGIGVSTAYMMLDKARGDALRGLPPTWRAASFINNYRSLESEAQWNAARKEGAMDDETAAMFSRNAIAGFGKAGDFLLKAEEISKSASGKEGDQPNPADRISMMQWVYENRILKAEIESPKAEDAEVVPDEEKRDMAD